MFSEEIKESLLAVLKELQIEVSKEDIDLEHPSVLDHGDYSTNIAMLVSAKCKVQSAKLGNPWEIAQKIVVEWKEKGLPKSVEKVEVAGAGFINIWLNFDYLINLLSEVLKQEKKYGNNVTMSGKKIMAEYAHPNTHKELHIGHMRTLITGESLARIFSACGAEVFRANYQGDIGPHVAKAIWGTEKLLAERKITWEEAEKLPLSEKAHLLGEGYIRGSQDYEKFEREIDALNGKLYRKDSQILTVYERTRRWSLEYYDMFYSRFGTKFDRLFFESEVAGLGKKIVIENIGKVFKKSEGAIIFDGELYGLHKRVFITSLGTPTYEAKDIALAQLQFATFPFDLNVHVVANEQTGYFKVMIKALEALFPDFKGKEYHLPMGMVNLVGKKISSRTGVILRVDDLLNEVKSLLKPLIQPNDEEKERILELGTIAAVKYSVLKVNPEMNVTFDLEKSVSLQGDSGVYLEYTFARTQSVLAKSKCKAQSAKSQFKVQSLSNEELTILRTFYRFPEVVQEAGGQYTPSVICNFLYDLCQKFNLFYDKNRIIGSEDENFRLLLVQVVGQTISNGLILLGINPLAKM